MRKGKFIGGILSQSNNREIVNINTTPLIDVMLVLIIMLIITIPVQLHKLDMKIGNEEDKSILKVGKIVKVVIDSNGKIILDNTSEIENRNDLKEKFSTFVKLNKNSIVQIIPHGDSDYQKIALVLTEAKLAGFKSISFVNIEKFLN